jgi:hypothetical protein
MVVVSPSVDSAGPFFSIKKPTAPIEINVSFVVYLDNNKEKRNKFLLLPDSEGDGP